MYKFSQRSLDNLKNVDERVDFTMIWLIETF